MTLTGCQFSLSTLSKRSKDRGIERSRPPVLLGFLGTLAAMSVLSTILSLVM